MRLSISKAIAAVALVAVGALIAISLLADADKASAQFDNNRDPFFVRGDLDSMSAEQAANYCMRGESEIGLDSVPIIRIGEGADIGDVITDYDACDPDGDDVSFVIRASADSAYFAINSGTGQLSVDGALDYESKPVHRIEVEALDDRGGQAQILQEIRLNDFNEDPFFVHGDLDSMSAEQVANYCMRDWSEIGIAVGSIIRIDENTAIGSVITDYDACDPDGDDVSFVIRASADSAYFAINSGTGQLSVDGALDYESKPVHRIEVEALDDRGGQAQILQEIRLNDPVAPTPTHTAEPTATPTTTPGNVSQDVLDRVGALEQLLAALQTLIQSLQGVIAAQDDRIAAQDGRIAALEAQLAATTPTPSPTASPSPTPTMTPEPTAASSACVQTMQPGSVSGRWVSGCLTANPTHGNTYYARFYTFTLDEVADVTITLSSEKPPYLYLLEGAGTSGDVLQETGDGGQTFATITDNLQAGSYTIEATTWNANTLGDFTLTLTARE